MEPKKISFGFSKITKKLNLLPSKENEPKVELIKCLEGQEIKLVVEKPEEQPLIIPLKESHKTSAALASLIKRRAVLLGEEEPEESTKATDATEPSSNKGPEDIEKRAARELLADVQKNDSTNSASNLVLPVVKPEDLPLEGAKESSLDDYDSIPIQDFGKAMLRGMGWTEPPKPNKKSGAPIDDTPMVRPKGMGLGADKALNKKPLLVAPEANEVLEVKRNAYVRILGGKHKDLYGQIEGFDDHAGRVIVKMAIGGAKEAFNEFLCQPVSKKEYAQYGKCINTSKYEEYKKKENEFGQIILNKEEKDMIDSKYEKKIKKELKDSDEEDYKYQKNKDNHQRNGEDRKDIKREQYEKDRDSKIDRHRNRYDEEKDRKRETYRDEDKNNRSENKSDDIRERKREYHREDDREQRRENNRDDERDRRRENNRNDERDRRREIKGDRRVNNRDDERDHRRENNRDDERDRRREYNRDDEKDRRVDNRDSRREYRRDDERNHKRDNNRDDGRDYHQGERKSEQSRYKEYSSSSRDNDRQRERDRQQHKVIELNDSSDSEKTHSSKHKKSKKNKQNKKKSKKSKSKYNHDSSSTSSSSSTDSSSDSEEEKYKKHKNKTKKSKKQRERSRSRGR